MRRKRKPLPFVCAECGTADAATYIVTGAVDDREGRTEFCWACFMVLTDGAQ